MHSAMRLESCLTVVHHQCLSYLCLATEGELLDSINGPNILQGHPASSTSTAGYHFSDVSFHGWRGRATVRGM